MTDPFDPLPGTRKTSRGRSPAKTQGWVALLPVPANAPAPPSAHYKRGKPTRIETYHDVAGEVLGYIWRFDLPDDGKEFLPLTFCEHRGTGQREWRWKSWPAPRPLYGLERLAARLDAPVIICEGEKAADAAAELLPDHVAVTAPGGSNAAGKANWAPVARRRVVIWPDADEPGLKYAAAAVRALAALSTDVKIITPPEGAAPGWDAADALAEGWDPARACALVESAGPGKEAIGAPGDAQQANATGTRGRQRPSQSSLLIELLEDAELWHSPDHEAHATVRSNGHFENWPIRSKGFRLWLSGRYFETHDGAPSAQATEDAVRVMEAVAIHKGPEYPVFLRVGEHEGIAYLDLTNERWQAVRITSQGREVVERPPVKFLRSAPMRPLPIPESGGSIESLRELVNLGTEGDFKLLIGWLLGALRPRGPYPILILGGEQGSGKSILSRLCRALVDPNTAPVRSAPRDEQSLLVAARNSWTIVLDNLSDLPSWQSDALCRLSTGGGFGARALYSDWEETVFHAQRPVILNGIPDLAARPDLADRCIHLILPALPDGERRTEAEFWAEFEAERPFILDVLLDAVSGSMRPVDDSCFGGRTTRMMDFARPVVAAETALGWHAGDFMEAYDRARQGAVDSAIEQDPIGEAVRALADEKDWESPPTELLVELEKRVSESVRKSRIWPHATKLRGRLRRLQAPLRSHGILLDLEQRASDKSRKRLIIIRKPERSAD